MEKSKLIPHVPATSHEVVGKGGISLDFSKVSQQTVQGQCSRWALGASESSSARAARWLGAFGVGQGLNDARWCWNVLDTHQERC